MIQGSCLIRVVDARRERGSRISIARRARRALYLTGKRTTGTQTHYGSCTDCKREQSSLAHRLTSPSFDDVLSTPKEKWSHRHTQKSTDRLAFKQHSRTLEHYPNGATGQPLRGNPLKVIVALAFPGCCSTHSNRACCDLRPQVPTRLIRDRRKPLPPLTTGLDVSGCAPGVHRAGIYDVADTDEVADPSQNGLGKRVTLGPPGLEPGTYRL